LKAEATAIDSSYRSQHVYNFTQPRHYRGIFGCKGQLSKAGIRNPIWAPGFSKTSRAVKLYFVSTDQVKVLVLERLAAPPFMKDGKPSSENTGIRNTSAYRFSSSLPDAFFEQAANERRYLRFIKNRPVHEFHPIQQGARTEALDCLVYGTACRFSLAHVNMKERSMRGLPKSQFAPPKQLSMGERYKKLADMNNAMHFINDR
jgi:phage terminase large subunit GpA-like protein